MLPLIKLRFFGQVVADTEERSEIAGRSVSRADGPAGGPAGSRAPSISTAKLWRWRSVVKLEIFAAVVHGVALEMRLNSRVLVYMSRVLETWQTWVPRLAFGIPFPERFGMCVGEAWEWAIWAARCTTRMRVYTLHYLANKPSAYVPRAAIEASRRQAGASRSTRPNSDASARP